MAPYRIAAGLLACWAAQVAAQQASFQTIGSCPDSPRPGSAGVAISADGTVIAGSCVFRVTSPSLVRAFKWSSAGGVVMAPSTAYTSTYAMAADSLAVVGYHSADEVVRGFLWRGSTIELLPPPVSPGISVAGGVNAAGTIVVGDGWTGSAYRALRWVNHVPEDLSLLPGDATPIGATCVSDNGELIGGIDLVGAVIIQNDVVRTLAPEAGAEAAVGACSADGRRAAGGGYLNHFRLQAFLWSDPTGSVALGWLPLGRHQSGAAAISPDGRVVGGVSSTDRGPALGSEGIIWNARDGMVSLNEHLDRLGVDRRGWFIFHVSGASRDGTRLTGTAAHPDGRREAFLVTLPPWCWSDCDADGVSDFNDLLCFLNRFNRAQADPRQNPLDFFYADLQQDDVIDFDDFLEFLRRYNGGC